MLGLESTGGEFVRFGCDLAGRRSNPNPKKAPDTTRLVATSIEIPPCRFVDPVTMSSSPSKGAAVQTAAAALVASPSPKSKDGAQVQPTQIKQTPVAQAARHGLPALLAAAFLVQFRPLVADPVSTMFSILIPLVSVIQLAYVLVCLPPAGSQTSKASRKPRPGEKKKQNDGPNTVLVCPTSAHSH